MDIFLSTPFLHPPGLCGSSGSWDSTKDHKETRIAKAAMKCDPYGDFETAIAVKREMASAWVCDRRLRSAAQL